jgi:hypothetical protein
MSSAAGADYITLLRTRVLSPLGLSDSLNVRVEPGSRSSTGRPQDQTEETQGVPVDT